MDIIIIIIIIIIVIIIIITIIIIIIMVIMTITENSAQAISHRFSLILLQFLSLESIGYFRNIKIQLYSDTQRAKTKESEGYINHLSHALYFVSECDSVKILAVSGMKWFEKVSCLTGYIHMVFHQSESFDEHSADASAERIDHSLHT